jgi:hypothetical protein
MSKQRAAELAVIETQAHDRRRIFGVVIGLFVGLDQAGEPRVDYHGRLTAGPLTARSTTPLREADRGREVALMFEDGDPSRPIIVGLMEASEIDGNPIAVTRDDERLVFRADREIVLQCGKASITLTRAGKVVIRGTYLLSRSSGVNMVKGGVVHLN